MGKPLRGQDIYFFDIDSTSLLTEKSNLSAPHLNVRLTEPTHAVTSSTSTRVSNLQSSIRNQFLFSLGIILVELGFRKSFKDLQEQIGDEISGKSEYVSAIRLAESLSKRMGSVYGNIVKQCLKCDFGCGEDLNNPKLQATFYKTVVQGLEGLEEQFRKIQL